MNSSKSFINRFVFLELLDIDVNAILNGLRNAFNEKKSSSNIHITVRGPYSHKIKPGDLDRYELLLQQYAPLFIGNVGIFNNHGEYIVYVKVVSEGLRKLWWKPDYPISQYGFNPHITIYKGQNKEFARRVFDFLKIEDLTLLCRKFHLTTYTSNKTPLFQDDVVIEDEDVSFLSQSDVDHERIENNFINLPFRGKVRFDIIERALQLKSTYPAN
ncbi:MAG: hypothetical protein HZB62_11380 [Nitrospirae bacterium]|nr:hypothetical protein [Nitrospirota bacterium]